MRTKVMDITPDIAKEMLERNLNNRSVSPSRVDMYADDMARGEWQANGEAICFNESGNLINGQHRLMAVVIRNDIISGLTKGRSLADSEKNSCMVENAIKDFVTGYKRKKTYKHTTQRVYGKEKKE